MATRLVAAAKQNRLSPEKRLETLLREPQTDLNWYYAVGKVVAEIAPTEAGQHYGQGKMEGLVRRFGKLRPGLRTLLHCSRHLVTAYKSSDLRRLSKLPWSHVARLTSIEDPATRKRLERRCIASKWTFVQLLAHCREELGIRPGGGSAAKPLQDVGPISTLSETIRLSDEWLRSYERRLSSPQARLWKVSRKTDKLSMRPLVSKTIVRLEEIEKAASKARKRLADLRARIDRQLGASGRQRATGKKSAGR